MTVMAEPEEFTVLYESSRSRQLIRAWQPGDGLTCSYSKGAPRSLPCGRPVAVTLTEDLTPCYGGYRCQMRCLCSRRNIRRILCANHLPNLPSPGKIALDARKQATEKLIAESWSVWKQYVEEAVASAVDEQLAGLDPELRRLICAAANEAKEPARDH